MFPMKSRSKSAIFHQFTPTSVPTQGERLFAYEREASGFQRHPAPNDAQSARGGDFSRMNASFIGKRRFFQGKGGRRGAQGAGFGGFCRSGGLPIPPLHSSPLGASVPSAFLSTSSSYRIFLNFLIFVIFISNKIGFKSAKTRLRCS